MKKIIATLLAGAMLTACATSTKNLPATYVSPMTYKNFSCSDLVQEANNIQTRVSQVGGTVDKNANSDKWLTGAGLVLFWPALLFVGHDKAQENEFSRLKGQYQAVQQAAAQKNCVARP